ncbi:hypothetical protein FA15DRAFT_602219, partial [Coprinopsis marcescibilis]
GIQFFMSSYALIVFFETPRERRQGRALYLISGWLIFTLYTVGACIDMVNIFQKLLEASNGVEYMQIKSRMAPMVHLNSIPFLFLFVVGDGLLLYRCYLLVAGGWLWLLALPVLMYLSVIGKYSTITLSTLGVVLVSRGVTTNIPAKVVLGSDVLTFLTNLLITSILCYRLVSAQRDLARSIPLAGKRFAVYRTAMRILVESALPLTIAGIMNMVISLTLLSIKNSSRITGFDGDPKVLYAVYASVQLVYFALQALAPQMIIFRVTTGRSWMKTDKSSAEALSRSLAFNHGQQPEESHLSGRLTRNDED